MQQKKMYVRQEYDFDSLFGNMLCCRTTLLRVVLYPGSCAALRKSFPWPSGTMQRSRRHVCYYRVSVQCVYISTLSCMHVCIGMEKICTVVHTSTVTVCTEHCTNVRKCSLFMYVLCLLQSLQMMHKRIEECRQMEHTWERECHSLKAEIDKEKWHG